MANDLFQPTFAELRDRILRDMRLAAVDAELDEPPVQPGSDNYMTATAVAGVGVLLFANVNSAESAANALDAVGEDLDHIREAEGLPEVEPQGSSGKIVVTILGATSIPDGTPGTLPNGLAFVTVGTVINPADQSEIDVRSVDTGEDTNLGGGETVRFDSPPVNVATDAVVSQAFPLRGGTNGEDEARMRARILNARRNRPAGGNWGQLRQWALEAVPSVQDAYVYPAPGGPSSCKVVPVRRYDFDQLDFSRSLSAAETQAVRSYIQSKMPIPEEVVIETCGSDFFECTLKLTLPDSALAGGNGQGWADPSPWPPTPTTAVSITAVASTNDQITVDAATATSPIAGQTHIAWWSGTDKKFYTRLVTAVTGSSGAWVLTLESPLLGQTGDGPQGGEYISPAAYNMDAYALAWMKAFEEFGPGENTDDSARLPRARRHPYTSDEDPPDLTNVTIGNWARQFKEISGYELLYASQTSPTVPASVELIPRVLIPSFFAIYPL